MDGNEDTLACVLRYGLVIAVAFGAVFVWSWIVRNTTEKDKTLNGVQTGIATVFVFLVALGALYAIFHMRGGG